MFTFNIISTLASLVARSAAAKALATHVLAVMLALAPPDAPRRVPETVEHLMARYQGIALAIATAAVTPRGQEVVVSESEAQRRAAVLVGIARHESGPFAQDVDEGPLCQSAAKACDGGRSVTVWQLMTRSSAERRLYSDRNEAAHEAMRRALSSEARCRGGEPYAAYASGGCDRGLQAARELRQYVAHAHMVLARVVARSQDPYAD